MALGQQILDRTQHERQRSAEFMADIAEECGLGAINFRQGFESLSLFFRGAGVLDGGRDLSGDQFVEGSIFRIEFACRIDPGD